MKKFRFVAIAAVLAVAGVAATHASARTQATYFFNLNASGAITTYAGLSLPAACTTGQLPCAKEFEEQDVEVVPGSNPVAYRVITGHQNNQIAIYTKPQ